jgi:hypothetical protein
VDTYDCYYLQNDTKHSQVTIVANSDAEALLRAEELLAESRFFIMETCRQGRLVGRVTLASPAELMAREGSGTPRAEMKRGEIIGGQPIGKRSRLFPSRS